MNPPIPVEEAWQRLFALARPLGGETIAVDDAAGRYLQQPLTARRTQPSADLSAMDGFAVAGGGPWRIVGEARAGQPFGAALRDGEAARISTGAACPAGTDGIVLIEDAAVSGETLTSATPEPGRWIRRRGFEFADGDLLLHRGARIGPAQIALVRAAGSAELVVGRLPRVVTIEIGDELVADPADCPPHRLPASNGAMVAAMAREVGARARQFRILADDREELTLALGEMPDADVIVTTAGASVGEHDHVRSALTEAGFELAFWRVAIRPGKPLLVAHRGYQIVLGLPGNPASSYVTAFLFLLPLLRAMQGASDPRPKAIPLVLAEPLPPGGDRREFRRARFTGGRVLPIEERDSSALRALASADLLIDRPVGASPGAPGDSVDCYWLGNGGIA